MDYYRRFPGDYARDTQHLSTFEHGVYTLLLDHLYATEKPIPDIKTALRIARISARKIGTQNVCIEILKAFFIKTSRGYWHKRVDEELKYAKSKSNKAKQSAKARWDKECERNADAMRTHSERYAIPDNQTTRQPDTMPSAVSSNGFEVKPLDRSLNGDLTKAKQRRVSPEWERLRISKTKT